MIEDTENFLRISSSAIENAFLLLLENKHLYQSVEIATSGFSGFIDRESKKELALRSMIAPGRSGGMPFKSREQILEDCKTNAEENLRTRHYQMRFGNNPVQASSIVISVPTIKAICQNPGCGGLWPHNACPDPSFFIPSTQIVSGLRQIFVLQYQCQTCKKEPISFLVKRDGLKLTLTGRSPMEAIEIPRFLPKHVRKFYRGALLAFNCGAVLPGIFMLRTMIEQHMRVTVNAGENKMTGDELTEAYAETIHPDFVRRFQSLKPVYSSLSETIHAAVDDNPELFDCERLKILAHFEAKEAFERLSIG